MSPRYDAKIKARRTREARPRSTANSDQADLEHLYGRECCTEKTGMYDGWRLLVGDESMVRENRKWPACGVSACERGSYSYSYCKYPTYMDGWPPYFVMINSEWTCVSLQMFHHHHPPHSSASHHCRPRTDTHMARGELIDATTPHPSPTFFAHCRDATMCVRQSRAPFTWVSHALIMSVSPTTGWVHVLEALTCSVPRFQPHGKR